MQEAEDAGAIISPESKTKFKRFNSTSDLNILLEMEDQLASKGEPTISQLNNADVGRNTEEHSNTSASEMMLHSDKHQIPKLKCRV